MKILLLGKNGLLGREISELIKPLPHHEFYALNHEELDITDYEAVYRVLNDFRPHLVINTAAFTYVDECETKREFTMTVNGETNGKLAELCKNTGAHLMYFSTDYVFNGEKDINEGGYKEDAIPSPINVYGKSKLLGEELIQKNTDNYYILRTSWLFGMHGKNFVKTIIQKGLRNDQLTVVDDQIGKPTYSRDLAVGVLDFIENSYGKPGIYHLVNEGVASWYGFAKKILKKADVDVQLIPVSSEQLEFRAPRPKNCVLDNTKLPHLRHHEKALDDYLKVLL
jgi:dTDP-4-dehydrorhamnose reductase